MNKYAHIKSLKDLDNEILRLKIKKSIIQQDLANNVDDFKESLRPMNLIKEALGISGSKSSGQTQFLNGGNGMFSNGKFFTYIKYIALGVSTIKGGASLISSIKKIFR